MPPVHFDGLRDCVINRGGKPVESEMLVSTYVYRSFALLHLASNTSSGSMSYNYGDTGITSSITGATIPDQVNTNGMDIGYAMSPNAYNQSSYFATYTNFNAGQSHYQPCFGSANASSYYNATYFKWGFTLGINPLMLVMYSSRGTGATSYPALTPTSGKVLVPAYGQFGYGYVHNYDSGWASGPFSSSFDKIIAYSNYSSKARMQADVSVELETSAYISKTKKSFDLIKKIRAYDMSTQADLYGTIIRKLDVNNTGTTVGDMTKYNTYADELLSRLSLSGWEQVGLRDVTSDKVYAVCLMQKVKSVSFNATASASSDPVQDSSFPFAYGTAMQTLSGSVYGGVGSRDNNYAPFVGHIVTQI